MSIVRSLSVLGPLVASAAVLLSACSATGLAFGDGGCRTVYVLSGGVVQPVSSCGGIPREALMAGLAAPVAGSDLNALLAAPKFGPDKFYTGVSAPGDKAKLTDIVNGAVRDLIAMPLPLAEATVRQRLSKLVADVDAFETEDRERAYLYAVLAWKAAGFSSESQLLPVPDSQVLSPPWAQSPPT